MQQPAKEPLTTTPLPPGLLSSKVRARRTSMQSLLQVEGGNQKRNKLIGIKMNAIINRTIMGSICGKSSKIPLERNQRRSSVKLPIIVAEPSMENIYTRQESWVGYKNLGNTCYINSGMNSHNVSIAVLGFLQHAHGILRNDREA